MFATYTCDPSGVIATPMGRSPTGTVATTVFVAVAITDTVLSAVFVAYTRDPSGVTATPWANCPTGTVATTVFVAMSRTDTLDRKSTRLNSSHLGISYAVFCLKKKKKEKKHKTI